MVSALGAATVVGAQSAPPAAALDVRMAPLGQPLEVLLPQYRLGSFTHFAQIVPARIVPRGGAVLELPRAQRDLSTVRYRWRDASASLDDYVRRHKVMAFVVLKDGAIVAESYLYGTNDSTPFVSWSVAKSVVGTLTGVALADGAIPSIDAPAQRFVPELAESGYGTNSLRDLLQMSSGVKFIEDYSGAASLEAKAWVEGNVTRTVRYTDTIAWFKERIHPAGTRFYYASMEPVVVGWVLHRATGASLSEYLSDKIWSRLGAEHDASWMVDRPGGLEIGSCCISATMRDYARFGLLVQHGGKVGSRQLVPKAWVEAMTQPDPTRPHLHPGKLEGKPEFGYQHYWWLYPAADRAAMARGAFGQAITVDFDDRVVIVQTAMWDQADAVDNWLETAALHRAIAAHLRTAAEAPKPRGKRRVAALSGAVR
jgi:CubicO group peptidase (beta-lactamase class C family)